VRNYASGYNYVMASTTRGSEHVQQALDVRLIVDAIPTLAWSARSDGSADFFNQRWLDYTGLEASRPDTRVTGAGPLPFIQTT
jgi:PAS domain-containing protein